MNGNCYVRTDTAEDAVSSLELAAEFIKLAVADSRYWKWFVVAFHAGLQGIFVLALDGGNSFHVQKPGVMKAMIDAHDSGATPPDPHMDNFEKLYKKIQEKENLRGPDSLPFTATDSHDRSVKALNELRDDFLHFNAKSWSIEVALIINHSKVCHDVAEFMITRSHSILWMEDAHKQRALLALGRLNGVLQARS